MKVFTLLDLQVNLGLQGDKMVSRDDIFDIAEQISGRDLTNESTWVIDMLKYFSTDELKDFFDDYARVRDFTIDWNSLILEDD